MRAGYLRQLLSRPADHLTTAALTHIEARPTSSQATGWLDLAAKTLVDCGAIPHYPPQDGDKVASLEDTRSAVHQHCGLQWLADTEGTPGEGRGVGRAKARGEHHTARLTPPNCITEASCLAHLDHKVAARALYRTLTAARRLLESGAPPTEALRRPLAAHISLPPHHATALTLLRISAAPLARNRKHWVPLFARVCQYCDHRCGKAVIEDEMHIVWHCPLYDHVRLVFAERAASATSKHPCVGHQAGLLRAMKDEELHGALLSPPWPRPLRQGDPHAPWPRLMQWAEALARATAWFAHRLLATRQIWMERHGAAHQFVFDREDCASKLDKALEHLQGAAGDEEVQGGRGQQLLGTSALEQWLGRPVPTELPLELRLRVGRGAAEAGTASVAPPRPS